MGVLTVTKTYADGQILGEVNLDNAFDSIAAFINNAQISGDNIQDNSIGAAEIQTSAITTAKIAANAVTTTKIADASITQAKLATALQAFLVPPSRIAAFAGDTAPNGWLMCDGLAYSRTTYATLFSTVGIRFGQGDGTTTFNVPDLRGRFLRGVNSGAFGISKTGSGTAGSNQATFTAHGLLSGAEIQTQSGSLAGLSAATTYYVIYVNDNTLAFATSLANALANTRISISGANTAVIAPFRDPEALERTASGTGGATGDNVGTLQGDDWKLSEARIYSFDGTSGSDVEGSGGASIIATTRLSNVDPTKLGIENRPINASVNFIIKV
jgi:microcystin-dependent protein